MSQAFYELVMINYETSIILYTSIIRKDDICFIIKSNESCWYTFEDGNYKEKICYTINHIINHEKRTLDLYVIQD